MEKHPKMTEGEMAMLSKLSAGSNNNNNKESSLKIKNALISGGGVHFKPYQHVMNIN